MSVILIMFPLSKGCGDQAESDPPPQLSHLNWNVTITAPWILYGPRHYLSGGCFLWLVGCHSLVCFHWLIVLSLLCLLAYWAREKRRLSVFLLLCALFPEQCLVQRQSWSWSSPCKGWMLKELVRHLSTEQRHGSVCSVYIQGEESME